MAISTETREDLVLQRLRDRYEQDGYSFHAHPPREFVPPFLGAYRPDAIALKDRGGVVIEIKVPTRNSEPKLSEIARLFRNQNDWRLQIITLDEVHDIQEISVPSRSLIDEELSNVEQLIRERQYRAAFAMGWAALEAVARALLAQGSDSRLLARYPTQIAETLARNGYLDQNAARKLSELVQTRNSVVHGNLSHKVDEAAVASLVSLTRNLVGQLKEHRA